MTRPVDPTDETPVQARLRKWVPFVALLASIAVVVALAVTFFGQTPAAPDIASPVEGVVVAVDSSGLSTVRGFTIRTSGGFAFQLTLGPLENAAEFSPSHLAEHMATSEPLQAWFRLENGVRVVYRLEDAPSPSST